MTLRSYELRDPGTLIHEVADRVPLTDDTAYLVLVGRPPTDQEIVTIRRLETPALVDEYDEACEELRVVVESLAIPDAPRPPTHTVVTVLVRPGLCVFGPNESCGFSAWRYSNHFANTYDGEVILVTEHGWCDFMTRLAGHEPALVA